MRKQLVQAIHDQVEAHKDKYQQLFYQLLSCETVNPPGDEEYMATLLLSWLAEKGAQTELQYVKPGRPNAIARLQFGNGGKKLLLNAHMDVVPPGEATNWKTEPFSPTEQDGKIYARGASDDKGGLMAMLIACFILQELQPELNGVIEFCGVMGEETGGMGTTYWVEQGGMADAAVIGEPSKMELVVAHRGAYRPIFGFRGRTAHSSEPDFGENAIYAAARFACRIAALNEAYKQTSHPLTGSPTIAATVFHGGVKNNVIPDYAEVSIDRRLSPGETFAEAEAELMKLLQDMQQNGEISQYEMVRYLNNKGAALVDVQDPLVTTMQDILRQRDLDDQVKGMRATTDMYLLQDHGIPTVIFGPGDMALAHCPNEYIPFQQILDAAEIYAELAIRFLE